MLTLLEPWDGNAEPPQEALSLRALGPILKQLDPSEREPTRMQWAEVAGDVIANAKTLLGGRRGRRANLPLHDLDYRGQAWDIEEYSRSRTTEVLPPEVIGGTGSPVRSRGP